MALPVLGTAANVGKRIGSSVLGAAKGATIDPFTSALKTTLGPIPSLIGSLQDSYKDALKQQEKQAQESEKQSKTSSDIKDNTEKTAKAVESQSKIFSEMVDELRAVSKSISGLAEKIESETVKTSLDPKVISGKTGKQIAERLAISSGKGKDLEGQDKKEDEEKKGGGILGFLAAGLGKVLKPILAPVATAATAATAVLAGGAALAIGNFIRSDQKDFEKRAAALKQPTTTGTKGTKTAKPKLPDIPEGEIKLGKTKGLATLKDDAADYKKQVEQIPATPEASAVDQLKAGVKPEDVKATISPTDILRKDMQGQTGATFRKRERGESRADYEAAREQYFKGEEQKFVTEQRAKGPTKAVVQVETVAQEQPKTQQGRRSRRQQPKEEQLQPIPTDQATSKPPDLTKAADAAKPPTTGVVTQQPTEKKQVSPPSSAPAATQSTGTQLPGGVILNQDSGKYVAYANVWDSTNKTASMSSQQFETVDEAVKWQQENNTRARKEADKLYSFEGQGMPMPATKDMSKPRRQESAASQMEQKALDKPAGGAQQPIIIQNNTTNTSTQNSPNIVTPSSEKAEVPLN